MFAVQYMVDPDELKKSAYVIKGIRVKFLDMSSLEKARFLGKTGLKLAQEGLTFILHPDLVEKLIKKGVVLKVLSHL